jgi:hypothetical protein
MKSLMARPFVAGEGGILKMVRRRRARVVLPEELGPERPIITVRSVVSFLDIFRVYVRKLFSVERESWLLVADRLRAFVLKSLLLVQHLKGLSNSTQSQFEVV